jgi:cyclase
MTNLFNRVIPCLLLKDGGLVKTTKFGQPRYVGDPINAIRIFNEKYVDELVFLDITASRTGAEPDYDLIARIRREASGPRFALDPRSYGSSQS